MRDGTLETVGAVPVGYELRIDVQQRTIEYRGNTAQVDGRRRHVLGLLCYLHLKNAANGEHAPPVCVPVDVVRRGLASLAKLSEASARVTLRRVRQYCCGLGLNLMDGAHPGHLRLNIAPSMVVVQSAGQRLDAAQIQRRVGLVHVADHYGSLDTHQYVARIVDFDSKFAGGSLSGEALQLATHEFLHNRALRHPREHVSIGLRLLTTYGRLRKLTTYAAILDAVWAIDCQDSVLRARRHIASAWLEYLRCDLAAAKAAIFRALELATDDPSTYARSIEIGAAIHKQEALDPTLYTPAQRTALAHQAVNQLKESVFIHVRDANYEAAQNSCFNLANTLYQLGNYDGQDGLRFPVGQDAAEILAWLDTCDAISDRFQIGKDSALSAIVRASVLARRYPKPDGPAILKAVDRGLQIARRNANEYELSLLYGQQVKAFLRANDERAAHRAYQSARRDLGASKWLDNVPAPRARAAVW